MPPRSGLAPPANGRGRDPSQGSRLVLSREPLYFFFFGLAAGFAAGLAPSPSAVAAAGFADALASSDAAAPPAAALGRQNPSTLPSGSAMRPISPPPANGMLRTST